MYIINYTKVCTILCLSEVIGCLDDLEKCKAPLQKRMLGLVNEMKKDLFELIVTWIEKKNIEYRFFEKQKEDENKKLKIDHKKVHESIEKQNKINWSKTERETVIASKASHKKTEKQLKKPRC